MKIKKAFIGFVFLLLAVTSCYAQLNFNNIEGKFFIKGQVTDMQSKVAIGSANVRLLKTGSGTTCDNDGYFTIYVTKKDTLVFTSTGYVSKQLAVNDIDSASYHAVRVELLHDFIKIPDIIIYPYRDLDDFKKAFLEVKIEKPALYGIPPPKYSHETPKAKLINPVSYLYEKLRHRRAANPDFKP